jgi:hypothetical protein
MVRTRILYPEISDEPHNPTLASHPNPFHPIPSVESPGSSGVIGVSSYPPGVYPYFFPALNKGNLARIPRGSLIGSAWVKPTSLPGCSYRSQGEMLWIRLDRGITPPMPWILCHCGSTQQVALIGLTWPRRPAPTLAPLHPKPGNPCYSWTCPIQGGGVASFGNLKRNQ